MHMGAGFKISIYVCIPEIYILSRLQQLPCLGSWRSEEVGKGNEGMD